MSSVVLPAVNASASPSPGLHHRYIRAALISALGGVVARVFQGLTPLVLARILGPSQYGVYTLLMAFLGMAAGTAHLGQNVALQKLLPECAVKDPARGKSILAGSVLLVAAAAGLIGLLLLLTAAWLAQALYHDSTLTAKLRLTVLLLLATVMFNLFSSAVLGFQDAVTYSVASVVRSATFLTGGSLGALVFGLYGAIAGQSLGMGIGLAILVHASCRLARTRFPGTRTSIFRYDLVVELLNFGIPALLAGLVVAQGIWWANTTLARSSGYEQLANFGVAWAIMQLILMLPANLSLPAVTFMSETYTLRGRQAFNQLVSDNLRLIWAVTLPMCFVCALFAEPLVALGFGKRYLGAVPLVPWMSLVALLVAVNTQVGLAISSLGKMWQALVLNLIWLLTFAPLAAWGAHFGAKGVVYAYCLSYLVFTGVIWQYSKRWLGIRCQRLWPLLVLSGGAVFGGALATVPLLSRLHGWMSVVLLGWLLWLEWVWVAGRQERAWMCHWLSHQRRRIRPVLRCLAEAEKPVLR